MCDQHTVQPKIFAGQKLRPAHLPLHYRNTSMHGINFCPCSIDLHRLYVIINTGQKFCGIKISPMRAGGEEGENYLQVKISSYTVDRLHCKLWH